MQIVGTGSLTDGGSSAARFTGSLSRTKKAHHLHLMSGYCRQVGGFSHRGGGKSKTDAQPLTQSRDVEAKIVEAKAKKEPSSFY